MFKSLKRKIREWEFNMGGTRCSTSEYGPEKTYRVKVIDKNEKEERIPGHPNPTVSDILGRTYTKIRKFVTFSNEDSREFRLDNKNAYDAFEVGNEANLTLREAFITTWNYQPPNFDEMVEIERQRDPDPNEYDRIVRLEKLIKDETGLATQEIDISETKTHLSRAAVYDMIKDYYTAL